MLLPERKFMTKKSFLISGSLVLIGAFLNGCGSSSGGGITSLSKIPKASGPVLTASSLAKLPQQMTASLTPWNQLENQFNQRAGIKVSDWSTAWANGKTGYSGPMCEAGQEAKSLYRGAVQPDMILCFIGAMADAASNTTMYDGNWKYYQVTGTIDGKTYALKTKFRVVKSGDSLSSFEMFNCNELSANQNDEYISVGISGSTANLTTRYRYGVSGDVYKRKLNVVGTFNDSGNWLSKQADFTEYYAGTGNFQGGTRTTLNQYSDALKLQGAYKTTFGSGVTASSYDSRYYVKMGISGADAYSTLAVGAGSGKRISTATWPGGGQGSSSNTGGDTRSWANDGQISTSSSYLSEVTAYDLAAMDPVVPADLNSGSELAFPTAAGWNCQSPTGVFDSAPLGLAETAVAACQAQFGNSSTNVWVNCGSTVGAGGYVNTPPVN